MKVSFRYCGSCNPQLDFSQIEENVRQEAKAAGEDVSFVPLGSETELCILLNACPVGCADDQDLESFAVKRLVIRGWKSDGQPDWIWEEGEDLP